MTTIVSAPRLRRRRTHGSLVPFHRDESVTLYAGQALDVLRQIPSRSVDCCVTSPPYFGLRDYGVAGQIGAEPSPEGYIESLRQVFAEVRRVLTVDGTLWLNLGDSYSGSSASGAPSSKSTLRGNGHVGGGPKQQAGGGRPSRRRDAAEVAGPRRLNGGGLPAKNLLGMPWRTALALQADGWILRNEIIWHKLTAMPESVTDRLSTRHEHLFLLSRSRRYHFDLDSIREPLARPEALSEGIVFGGSNKAASLSTGSSATRTGAIYGQRPQRIRAEQLAREKGLTAAHLEAIRAVGMGDTGKAVITQSGSGRNRPEMRALADEAKAALGGYYREFLTPAGKNPGDVWSLSAEPFPGAHFATFPSALPRRCILAGAKVGGTVLDPFSGSGTTGMVAQQLGRKYIGIDLNPEYLKLSLRTRLCEQPLEFPA